MSTNCFANSASLMYLGKNLKILITVSPGDLISFLPKNKESKTLSIEVLIFQHVFFIHKNMFPSYDKIIIFTDFLNMSVLNLVIYQII